MKKGQDIVPFTLGLKYRLSSTNVLVQFLLSCLSHIQGPSYHKSIAVVGPILMPPGAQAYHLMLIRCDQMCDQLCKLGPDVPKWRKRVPQRQFSIIFDLYKK